MQYEEILNVVRVGSPVVIFDDQKEGEGDLFCPAAVAAPEVLQFMIRLGSGLLCLAMPRDLLEDKGIPRISDTLRVIDGIFNYHGSRALVLRRMVDSLVANGLPDTPFHFPVDKRGLHSGISVSERFETIQALIDPNSSIDDFEVPGHLFTLGAHPNGFVGRQGHTESAVALAEAAGLFPAGLLCEIVDDNGEALKTAPLFQVSSELGIRAGRHEWLINIGREYGYNCGMAFQVYDDYSDMHNNVGMPWKSIAKGELPTSLAALQARSGGGEIIAENHCASILQMGNAYIATAMKAARCFPDTEIKHILLEFPQACCDALIAEAPTAKLKLPEPEPQGTSCFPQPLSLNPQV